MQATGVISKSRRVIRVLKNLSPCSFNSPEGVNLSQAAENGSELRSPALCRRFHFTSSGTLHGNCLPMESYCQESITRIPTHIVLTSAPYSTEVSAVENDSAGTAKEVYDKMLNCVAEKRTAPPNAWLWSLLEKCSNHEDIKLLFDILQRLRLLRLSNLRIPDNFNSALCREVTKACARVGAIDFGKKALWKHNLYGLTPDIGSAHHLLLHAKQHRDVKLMVEVMKLVKKNELPLQPGTADLVFSICYDTDRWDLISKYGKRFVTSGVRLRQTSFDMWMEFAARKGDSVSLWKIEKWRSELMKQHSLATGFSCAKGFLLESKPENAAAIIQILNQNLSDAKRPGILVELQKLDSEWTSEVLKHQKEESRQALAAALQNDIPAMINALSSLGVDANVNMKNLTGKEAVFS
ncbi:uncharacterized protein LOC111382142 [Olea europaea var. sylvestris]|uniref:uncharacterized protein LOC111382142 n=1 Tax=Olea europaea var. sylvestris TaxID=158386 RepID=UPI000C1D3379|nr:uncharacterized protein LOC111382142 [Olea europaea var. sylvestris]